MPNINDSFFDGHYQEIWKTIIPDGLTTKEVEFMVPYFNLVPGGRVLDLMCGYGRHALAFGRMGIEVTAVDNLGSYVDEIKKEAEAGQLPVTALQQSVVDFSPVGQYDLAICMGNSLNFFDATDTAKILAMIHSALKPGGHVLLNSWSLAEIIYPSFREKSWSTFNGLKFLVESKILFHPARVETESQTIAPDGSVEIKKGIDYLYTLNEMETMMRQAGLQLIETYSIPGRKKFSLGDPRAYLIAQKI